MKFDFYLKVLQDRFNSIEDYTHFEMIYSNIKVALTKINEERIEIKTDEICLYIESSHMFYKCFGDDIYEINVNLYNKNRVVIITNLTYTLKETSHLAIIFDLLYEYFNVILIQSDEYMNESYLLSKACKTENIANDEMEYLCFCNPGAML